MDLKSRRLRRSRQCVDGWNATAFRQSRAERECKVLARDLANRSRAGSLEGVVVVVRGGRGRDRGRGG
jgi:hypothetical protein